MMVVLTLIPLPQSLSANRNPDPWLQAPRCQVHQALRVETRNHQDDGTGTRLQRSGSRGWQM